MNAPASVRLRYAPIACLLPVFFCLIVYGPGLRAWFQMDDFIWLFQATRIHSLSDLGGVLFTPTAHGTWRPWSERLPFLLSAWLFPGNALPFRIVVFLTVFANFALLFAIILKLTRSQIAAIAAPLLWAANSALAFPMAWSSAYMQFLCGFCILLAFHLWLRFLDTNDRRYYWVQCVVFLFGLGVMETMAVYPLIAFAYVYVFAPRRVQQALPLVGVSAIFLVVHLMLAPGVSDGPYAMHFDAGILSVFFTYWKDAFVAPNLKQMVARMPVWGPFIITAILLLAHVAYVAWATWRKQYLPLFFSAVFVILLLPVLPLRDHIQQYYLTLPAIALAALWATAIADASRANLAWKAISVALVCLFVGAHWRTARFGVRWWTDRSLRIESLVRQVDGAHRAAPAKTIVLTNVSEEFYTGAIRDRAFPALGIPDVYLDKGNEAVDPATLMRLKDSGKLLVLSLAESGIQDQTATYAIADEQWPSRIDLSRAADARWLGPTWHRLEPAHRWMPKAASVKLRAPRNSTEKLYIHGYCPPEQVHGKPLEIQVLASGTAIAHFTVKKPGSLDLEVPLPAQAIGRDPLEITIELDHTFRPSGDIRDLGLVVISIEIR